MTETNIKPSYYVGLMSGTSADGIDLALVDCAPQKPVLIASYYQAYDDTLKDKITRLYDSSDNEIEHMGSLDIELAQAFATAINDFLSKKSLKPADIIAIGNHGQTIRHRPPSNTQQYPFTIQIGCNDTLAALTNIRVIGQFRRKDIAYGGQGAPLVPAFHKNLLSNNEDLFIVNIGGIANITYLPAAQSDLVLGFDTGPGNALLDDWYCQHHKNGHFDEDGRWAQTGKINTQLLEGLLADNYFSLAPPKSTGREYFNARWLKEKLALVDSQNTLLPQDVQATLSYLTALTISQQIKLIAPSGTVYLCGGGAHNKNILSHIKQGLKDHKVTTLSSIGLDGDALEAMAFAWFAFAFDKKITGNIPSVTGASKALVLGTEFLA